MELFIALVLGVVYYFTRSKIALWGFILFLSNWLFLIACGTDFFPLFIICAFGFIIFTNIVK